MNTKKIILLLLNLILLTGCSSGFNSESVTYVPDTSMEEEYNKIIEEGLKKNSEMEEEPEIDTGIEEETDISGNDVSGNGAESSMSTSDTMMFEKIINEISINTTD